MALRNQGMILGENGEKMSKSRGNVVNPDDVINEHGADTLRIYEMFMGPLAADKPWNTQSIFGIRRFIEKAWRLFDKPIEENVPVSDTLKRLRHKTVKFVSEKIDGLEFNTAISQLMIFSNALQKEDRLDKEMMRDFVKLLHPFAPFVTEELWEFLGGKPSVLHSKWPEYDEELTKDEEASMVVQVNGKLRETISIPRGTPQDRMKEIALGSERIKSWTEGKEIVKIITVPDKLVNIVVK
jgi:leucyl-tRNA synthetase